MKISIEKLMKCMWEVTQTDRTAEDVKWSGEHYEDSGACEHILSTV